MDFATAYGVVYCLMIFDLPALHYFNSLLTTRCHLP
jgi:hypothetical protein